MVSPHSKTRKPHSAPKDKVRVGTSGYNYPHWWNGVFYPSELSQRKWLEFYAGHFDTVELNVSFYRLPKKEVFESWYKRTPEGFLFSVKGNRYITHVKRLKDCREPVTLLLDHASPLKEKMGILLWQLPPRFKFKKERLEEFCVLLSTLPRSKRLRHAFEFRDQTWLCREAFRDPGGIQFCLLCGPWVRTPRDGNPDLGFRLPPSSRGAGALRVELFRSGTKGMGRKDPDMERKKERGICLFQQRCLRIRHQEWTRTEKICFE